MSLISIKDLIVNIENNEVLNCVSLDINHGDFIAVIGPNGGGKTTLMKAILGIISYEGKIVYSDKIKDGNKIKIGYMPQISNFDRSFPITLLEVVLSGLQGDKFPFGGRWSKSEVEYAHELMRQSGVDDLAKRRISEVSGGQLQRALLCRAIISKPSMLILDEPTNFVDSKFENELYSLLKVLNKDMTILMVSHDIGTVSGVVKQIVCVNRSVHRHESNIITQEQLLNYDCPIRLIAHGNIPHSVLEFHPDIKM